MLGLPIPCAECLPFAYTYHMALKLVVSTHQEGQSTMWIYNLFSITTETQMCKALSPVYQCSKLGALNPRINKIKSDKIWFLFLQVQTPRFYIPTIFWLSNLVTMYPRASGTIMDSSLHVSSHSYACQLLNHGARSNLNSKWNFSLKNMCHWSCFCHSSSQRLCNLHSNSALWKHI
jgi:hypothetical protein